MSPSSYRTTDSQNFSSIEPLLGKLLGPKVFVFFTLNCLYNAFESLYLLLMYLILLVILSSFKYSRHLFILEEHFASRGVKHHFKA